MTIKSIYVCHKCGKTIDLHGAYIDVPPIDAIEGTFDIPTTGFYCPS